MYCRYWIDTGKKCVTSEYKKNGVKVQYLYNISVRFGADPKMFCVYSNI